MQSLNQSSDLKTSTEDKILLMSNNGKQKNPTKWSNTRLAFLTNQKANYEQLYTSNSGELELIARRIEQRTALP